MSGMKKYVSTGLLALLTTAYLTSSCSRDDFSGSIIEAKKQAFSDNFKAAYGTINPLQDWGFGSATTRGWALTRSMSNPSVPAMTAPYDEDWVATYMETAKEPTAENVVDDYDNSYYQGGSVTVTVNPALPNFSNGTISNDIMYSGGTLASEADRVFYTDTWLPLLNEYYALPLEYNGQAWVDTHNAKIDKFMQLYNAVVSYAGESGVSNWLNITSMGTKGAYTVTDGTWVYDENYVLNFKITRDWTGYIKVGANAERTIVVGSGAVWYITDQSQTIGGDAKVIVASGGAIHIGEGLSLTLVNQARLVVLPGGAIEGKGNIEVTNGNATGYENYNGGTINITGTFNNNFGKFFNYGTFDVANYASGGSGEGERTNGFYNHGVAIIGNANADICRNARIYNACQFYVKGDMQAYILEETQGASFLVDGELRFNGGNDGTNDPTYVALGAGALVKCGTLWNQGATWYGPTSGGYAVLSTGQVVYLNWDATTGAGYFHNNLYIELKDGGTNDPEGNGNHENNNEAEYPYRANYKVFELLAVGNVTKITETNNASDNLIPASENFVKGVSGCTPGYNGVPETEPGGGDDETTVRVVLKECGRIFCEDLGNVSNRDMDYNDAVFDAWIYVKQTLVNGVVTSESHYRTYIQLLAAGGTIPVDVAGEGEIHKKFGVGQTTMVNTYIPNVSEVREDLCVDKTTLPAEYEIRNGLDYYYARDVDGDGIGDICLKNIPIFVEQGTEATELEAIQGDAPQKYCATLGTLWAGERVQIDWAYTAFMSWVNKIENPWESGVPQNLYSDSGLKRSDGTAYNPQTAHGDEMEYDPNDDPSTTTGEGTGSSTGGGTSGTSFSNVTGNVVHNTQTPLSSGSGITLEASKFNDAMAADIYIYGTGDGSVEVNGASTEDVSSTSAAPIYNFTRGFGFTRSAETPVVKKCTLGPKQFHGQDIGITGNNFTVYKVSYDPRLPAVSQPTGNVLVSSASGIEMNWAQAGQQKISADRLTGIGSGTIIRVAGVGYADNINSGDNNTSWQVELDIENPWTKIDAKTYWTENSATGAVTLAFELSGEQAAALLNSQLCVQGVNFILKYVTVDNSNVTPSGGGGGNATATINLVTSTNTITVNNSSTGKIVGDQTTARGYASRIVAGTTRLEGKVKINADDTNTSQYWSYQLGAGNSGNDLIGEVRGDGNNTSNWRTNEEKTINLLLTDNLKQKIDAVVENSWWAGGMFTFQGHNVTLTELKLTNCLPAE